MFKCRPGIKLDAFQGENTIKSERRITLGLWRVKPLILVALLIACQAMSASEEAVAFGVLSEIILKIDQILFPFLSQ